MLRAVEPDPPSSPPGPSWTAPLALFVLFAAAIGGVAALSYLTSAADLRANAGRELATISLLKVRELVRWRDERISDADTIALQLAVAVAQDHELARPLENLYEALRSHREYPAVAFVGRDGDVRFMSGAPLAEFADAAMLDVVRRGSEGRRAVLTPIHRHAQDPALHLNLIAPVTSAEGALIGSVVLRVEPRRQLFAMLQSWPLPSESAETLLVEADGTDAVVVNELRDGTGAMTVRVPLGSAGDVAALAASGVRGVVEAHDHRGRAVLAAVVPVPDSAWTLVAKVGAREALAPVRSLRLWTAVVAFALVLAGGAGAALWHSQAMARDVRAREQAAEAVRASEAKFRAAFEFASLGILIVAADGRIVETNRAMRRMLGYGDDEMRGLTLRDIHEPGDERARSILAGMIAGTRETMEMPRRYLRKDGSVAEAILRASALRDDAGAFRFALGVVEDVSEKKRLEAHLVLADRMASVGTLAAGVAHEINNPLAFILSNLEFALSEISSGEADPELRRALQDAKDGAVRVRGIVRSLRTFSRPGDDERAVVDPRRVLDSALALAANEIRHRGELTVDRGDVPPVLAPEHRLRQVLLNLLVNAAQALPEGRTRENRVRAATSTSADGRAVLEVSDTGAGIPPDVLPRIFDPFFTTKPVGVGTGLGLSVCHGIVTQLGGYISVESAPGKGSTFRVVLPAAPESARSAGRTAAAEPATPAAPDAIAPAPVAPAPAAPGRRGRVLVVDDEPLVGRALVRMLSPLHDVVAQTSPRAALELLREDRAFDVVFCDLMMPEMTGMELHASLAAIAPAVAARMVFLTGGAFTADAREFLARVANAHLEKPVDKEALQDVVARALAPAA